MSSARIAYGAMAGTIAVAMAGAAIGLAVDDSAAGHAFAVIEALMLAAIAAVGAVVTARVPDNACGWLVAVIPASFGVTILGTNVHDLVLQEEGSVEGVALVAPWLASWSWIPALVAVAFFGQLFPTGHPLPGRWRLLMWTGAASAPLLFVGTAFEQGRFEDFLELDNPVGAGGRLGDAVMVLGGVGFFLLLVTVVGAIVSLIVRWRRSRGAERQQLKWVATALLTIPAAFAAPTDSGAGEDVGFALFMLSLFLVAAAVAVAILRYRLYDLDLVIRRTVTYAVLSAALAGTYFVSVLVAQLVLPAGSDLTVALSTLAVTLAFAPVRARIQAGVDRRFFRRRYDAQHALGVFAARVRDQVDLDVLGDDLRVAVTDTFQPAHVSLWLRRG